jgi:2-dehydro-3-deoxygluconokinase
LPKNDLGEAAIQRLRGIGIDTRSILRGGERIGIYFLETGAAQRASNVIYDRANSAIATARPDEFDWATIFRGARWFHITGITPALSATATEASLAAVRSAKQAGLTVSCDLNFRKKLWTSEQAKQTMSALADHVDYCIANEEDAEKVFGIRAAGTNVSGGKIDHAKYEAVAKQLTERFGFAGVAITLRESHSASHNGWSGMFYRDGKAYFSRQYEMQIVDRVGGGDAFAAGIIYGLLADQIPQQIVEFAAAASCLKHSIPGDFNFVSLKEVETLVGGDASGRVQR